MLIAVGRNQYLAGLHPPQSPEATAAVIDTVTATLRDSVRIILVVAALVAIGGLLAGNAWVRAKVGDLRKPGWVTERPGPRLRGRPPARPCSGRSWPSAC